MDVKVLVLEDETSIRKFMKIKLNSLGYEVIEAANGKEALMKMDRTVKIALLDIMLPDIDGVEVCKKFRNKYSNLGIIMLTAKGQEDDKVFALKTGADDYIVKPFSTKELEARIESLLRRISINSKGVNDTDIVKSGEFILDMNKKNLKKNDEVISLTPKEYAIIEFFINSSNIVLSRNKIFDEVWGENYYGDIKAVDVNIRRIRQKIEEDPSNPKYLKTSWGYGYIWSSER
ncbi:response regulator [Haloimpatiens sp. FM7330]|uniref:response regulator n=1 Tax=Haloimpatiens sp. FM7330 TaxID=3298610 RepID=UPI0036417760